MVTRPDRQLAANKRAKYCDTGEASRELGGLISAGILRQMALNGEIKGAIQVRHRVLIPRHVVSTLVTELEFSAQPAVLRHPPRNTFDAYRAG